MKTDETSKTASGLLEIQKPYGTRKVSPGFGYRAYTTRSNRRYVKACVSYQTFQKEFCRL